MTRPGRATRLGRAGSQRGTALVDLTLVTLVLLPVVLGIVQVALVLHVRTTLAAAASEGARLAATADRDPADGVARTREVVATSLSGRYARDVTARRVLVDGAPGVEITVRAVVPALGLGGPGVELAVTGRAVSEVFEAAPP
ncbi:TadE/TadG family type IV pilus assembly protein [Pimelobacter simplex]|uniref:TadE/TadG family type IV pilus assembly protein n=1 Tax=Nocardioides simplex TaxID=2045 RepID=UPI0021504659|nr:TadE/TadG family type IV pilus assembly protein [Pimelobacter simplex]UUW92572.1 pilus assembly protein [Pimelobacter simplex]UUW96399.1 pilus assembly protein [Pimelobacter simplex]